MKTKSGQVKSRLKPMGPQSNLATINHLLNPMTAQRRIEWAIQSIESGLFALTSAGIDSALILEHIAKTGHKVPIIFINTGFLPKETLSFRDKLIKRYGLQLFEYGPTEEQIADINLMRLWDGDLELYSKLTKLEPMSRAIEELGVKALLTGVRGDQTDNRSTLGFIGEGNDGEFRIRPFIDWSKSQVTDYLDRNGLPRNALYKKGFESVADQHTTTAGEGRKGRTLMECGIHVEGGKIIRGNS